MVCKIGLIQLSFIPVCSLNTCNISVKLCQGFALQCFSLLWLHSLSGVIRSLLCKPHAFSPAITRTWNRFALQCFSLLWLHSLSGVIRSLLCKPHAFSPAITRTWNTWSRTERMRRIYNTSLQPGRPSVRTSRQIIDACGYEETFIALALRT